jgi:hypothetical protein
MEFMPEHAPLAVMAFLGMALLLGVTTLVMLVAFLTKRKWIGFSAVILGLVFASAYALVLAGVSLTSHEKTLAPGENKYFCEIDCHIAYSVVNFEEARALGDEEHQTFPAGRFVIVRLKTWFDPSTISEHRGDSPLGPGPRQVVLVDDAAHPFLESAQGKAALARLGGGTIPLSQPLRPGESYVTDLVFDVPANARNLRLFVGDTFDVLDRLLIGHEDSFLHRKIYLALTPPGTVLAGRVP